MAQDRARRARLKRIDSRANRTLLVATIVGSAIVVLAMIWILIQIIQGSSEALSKFGLGFLTSTSWLPTKNELGGLPYIYGTVVSSLLCLILSTLVGVSIGIFLALMAPPAISAVVGPLVELLAAIPSVILGLIGIELIVPFLNNSLDPFLHSNLGFIPLFGPPGGTGASLFAASLVLTIMVVPIISSLTRDLFMTVPSELMDGAEALGCTRWEMIRGVVFPTTRSGVTAACVLGFGRAIGEAIAVIQVIGNDPIIHANLFLPSATIAASIANSFESVQNGLEESALFYLVLILFAISILTNLLSRYINRRGVRL